MMLVYGRGWLGQKFTDYFNANMSSLDILDTEQVAKEIEDVQPDVVVNAAGKCGTPNIDWCERTEENRRLTLYTNAFGPITLFHVVDSIASLIQRRIQFVHLSTGCLWTNGKDIDEERIPEPKSWYAKTKVEGESRLPLNDTLIIRMRMPIDDKPNPRNLITKIAGYSTVLDEQNSITVVDDMLYAVEQLLKGGYTGIFNVVNSGTVSAVDIAQAYTELVDSEHHFERADSDWLQRKGLVGTTRPSLTLSLNKLLAAGVDMPDVRMRMIDCMRGYAQRVR